jgi:hypothetical protein
MTKETEKLVLKQAGFTLKTANTAGSAAVFIRVSANAPNPVKYLDPDGNASNQPLIQPLILRQMDTVIKIAMFYIENKDAIQKIGIGVLKVAGGVGLGGLGVGGGAGITVGSGGTATLGGVAVAGAAITAGGVYVGAGVADVLDGIVMMAGDGNWPRESQNSQRSYNQNDKNDIRKALNKISNETGKKLNIGKKEEDAIHKAIKEMKVQVNPPGSNQNLSEENLQLAIKNALNIER